MNMEKETLFFSIMKGIHDEYSINKVLKLKCKVQGMLSPMLFGEDLYEQKGIQFFNLSRNDEMVTHYHSEKVILYSQACLTYKTKGEVNEQDYCRLDVSQITHNGFYAGAYKPWRFPNYF